jgi:hypothetical protein
MIYTNELVVWQIISTVGLASAALLLRFRILVLKSVVASGQDADLIDGATENRRSAFILTVIWLGLFGLGVLAVLDVPTPKLTTVPTLLGQIVGWLLIGMLALWAYLTTSNYAYTLRKWWESPISSTPAVPTTQALPSVIDTVEQEQA